MTIIVEYVKYIIELMTYLFFIKNILEYQLIGHKTQKILMIILLGYLICFSLTMSIYPLLSTYFDRATCQ